MKEVIDRRTGNRLGPVCDVEVDTCCGRVVALIVYGRPKYLGLFGRGEDLRVAWENVEVIGDETVLVTCAEYCRDRKRGR